MDFSNFFYINLPYGLQRKKDGSWFAFNRYGLPLGCSNINLQEPLGEEAYKDYPIASHYNLTEGQLRELAGSNAIEYDQVGMISRIYLYSRPFSKGDDRLPVYFQKLTAFLDIDWPLREGAPNYN